MVVETLNVVVVLTLVAVTEALMLPPVQLFTVLLFPSRFSSSSIFCHTSALCL